MSPDATDAQPDAGRVEGSTDGPPRWLIITLVAVAVAALAFAIGRFSTFGSAAEAAAPTTDSAEAGFARDMQLHHAQAVEMAMIVYPKTTDPEVRTLAYDIVTVQSEQRGEMYSWLVDWGLRQAGGPVMAWMDDVDGHGGHGTPGEPLSNEEALLAMGMATDAQLAELAAAEGATADCLFLDLMVTHHLGALDMIDAVLDRGSEQRVLDVAQRMKDGQRFELDSMRSMQQRLACAP